MQRLTRFGFLASLVLSVSCGSDTTCTVASNADGTSTISCDDGTSVIVGQPDDSCTIADNADGSSTITCADGTTVSVGGPDASCTIADNADGTSTITCADGTTVIVNRPDASCTVTDGADGTATIACDDGSSVIVGDEGCSIADNGDGTSTITCDDGTSVTVGGEGCSIADNGDGTSTITCDDGTSVTVGDTSCSIAANGDGTSTITCPDGSSVVVGDSSCTVISNADGTSTVTCDDGTAVTVGQPDDSCTIADNGDGTSTITCDDGSSVVVVQSNDPCPDMTDANGDRIPDLCPMQVLLVQGSARAEVQAVLEGWGFTVTVADGSTLDSSFDYSPYDVVAVTLSSFVADLAHLAAENAAGRVGVVLHRADAELDDFELGTGGSFQTGSFAITDAGHYITAGYSLGPLDLGFTNKSHVMSPTASARVLGTSTGPSLVVHRTHRRVVSPYYGSNVGFPWTTDAGVLTWRSYIWAAGRT